MIATNTIHKKATEPEKRRHTVNACKLCAPLGASMVFKGIRGCVPLVHGSQGCSTYIRRYLIGHFREPVDIASSNFSEASAVFGGEENFFKALDNISSQYRPEVIGIASTCLSETIGDDLEMLVRHYRKSRSGSAVPFLINVSTPSYRGTHMDGFHAAVKAVAETAAEKRPRGKHINIFPGFVSPADLRELKRILKLFSLDYVMLPDYSTTLDGPGWDKYHKIPEGGTPLDKLKMLGSAAASIELSSLPNCGMHDGESAAEFLEDEFGVKAYRCDMPVGVENTDRFLGILSEISGEPVPDELQEERGRLIDLYIDSHKYFSGIRAAVAGGEDFAISTVSFLEETGISTILCGSGGESGKMEKIIIGINPGIEAMQRADYDQIDRRCQELKPDIIIGSSKAYPTSRQLGAPLIRMDFPVHDRVGAQRILRLGYAGTSNLTEAIANAIIEVKQDSSPVGYKCI